MYDRRLKITFFGAYRLEYQGRVLKPFATEKSRSLFAFLVLHPSGQTRHSLASKFWPELSESNARRRLTQTLWRIRNLIREEGVPEIIQADGLRDGVVRILPTDALICDVHELQRWMSVPVEQAADLPAQKTELARLYGGELLPGLFDDWVLLERERIFQAYCNTLEKLLSAAHKNNLDDQTVDLAQSLIDLDPMREEAVLVLANLYQEQGRPANALELLQNHRQRLKKEFGLEPGARLTALEKDLKQPSVAPPTAGFNTLVDPQYSPPLLEREGERSRLIQHLDHGLNGVGAVVSLEGAAGVGKTHLMKAIAEDARWRGFAVGWGMAEEIQTPTPYYPLVQAIQSILSPLRIQQLAILLNPIWLATAAQIIPDIKKWLPEVPPLPTLEPEAHRIRVLETLTRLVFALSEFSPLLLVVDNIQWADSATLNCLAFIARRISRARLVIIVIYRADEVRESPVVWSGLRDIDRSALQHRFSLSPLSEVGTAALVREVLRLKQPAPIFEGRIYQETQGNPLYILETLRTLYQEGNLTMTPDGTWQTPWDAQTRDYSEARLPSQVSALVERRLAHLDDEERIILHYAAVLGGSFDLALLTRLAPFPARRTLAMIGDLVQRRFLQETEIAYRFEHDTIRQAVYQGLRAADRKKIHRQAAAALRRSDPENHTALAFHYETAGAYAEAWEPHWLAAKAARSSGSFLQARTHYERAIACLAHADPQSAKQFDLLLEQEFVLHHLGERDAQKAVMADLQRIEGLTRRQLVVMALRTAAFDIAVNSFDQAIQVLNNCCVEAQELGDLGLQAEALLVWGDTLLQLGDMAGIEKLRQAVQLARDDNQPALESRAFISLADGYRLTNNYSEARAILAQALEHYHAVGDMSGEASAYRVLAILQSEQGDLLGGIAAYNQALALAERAGYRLLEARLLANLANAHSIVGDIGLSISLNERAIQITRFLGDRWLETMVSLNYASVYLTFIGPDEEHLELVKSALAYCTEINDEIGTGQAWNLMCIAAYYQGDLFAARQHLNRSIEVFNRIDYSYLKIQALRAQATLALAENDLSEAHRLVGSALILSEEIQASQLIAELQSIHGEVLLRLGDIPAAQVAAQAGVDGFDTAIFQSYLLYYRHFLVFRAAKHYDEAVQSLEKAYSEFQKVLDTLTLAQRKQSETMPPDHRRLLVDAAAFLPRIENVQLPAVKGAAGELVFVTWEVHLPGDLSLEDDAARRLLRLERMLDQAAEQGGVPTNRSLAEALGVSIRTIERDKKRL